MILNVVALTFFAIVFLLAGVFSPHRPSKLFKVFFMNAGLTFVIVVVAILWGYEFYELITLQAGGKSGAAVGGAYGMLIGSGVAALISLAKYKPEEHKEEPS